MRTSIQFMGVVAVTAFAVAACGGGGYGDQDQPMANPAPTVSAVTSQSIDQDTSTAELAFAVSDRETDPAALTVRATSSDTTLLPEGGMVLGGSGGARTIKLTPAEAAVGSANVTLTVTDGAGLSTSRTFQVAVNAVFMSFTGWTTKTFGDPEEDPSKSLVGFTFDNDADDNDAAFDALLQ